MPQTGIGHDFPAPSHGRLRALVRRHVELVGLRRESPQFVVNVFGVDQSAGLVGAGVALVAWDESAVRSGCVGLYLVEWWQDADAPAFALLARRHHVRSAMSA